MGLIRPRRLLIPPGGLARPSREALGKGLSFAQAMTNGPSRPYVSAGAVPGAFVSGAALGMTRGGMAMVGGGGYWRAPSGAGTTYTLPTTRGTVFFHGFSVTASYDATFSRRYMWTCGNAAAWPASPWCGATDFDGLIYAGWVNGGVDGRVTASSASGAAWPAQSLVTVALSYGPGGQRLYLNGRFAGSNSFTNFGSTAAGVFSAGDGDGLVIPWARTTGDAVHYFTVYEREFSDGEHHDAHQNPWWWIEGQRQPFGRNIPPPPEPEPEPDEDTGPRGGDDAPASSADVRRMAARRRRLEAEEAARAARLRDTLERAYRAATGAVEDASADTLEAAENALQAVAAVEPGLPVLDIAPLLGTAQALEELSRLIQWVQTRRDRLRREDDELAMILAVL